MPKSRFALAPLSALLIAGFLGACATGPAAAQDGQPPKEVKKSTHGDWDVVCIEGRDVCAMRQIGSDSQGNEVLAVTIRELKDVKAENGEVVPAAMDVLAPLGVALKAGLRVKIDGGQERAAPFDICLQNGCLMRSPMSADFLAQMKRGTNAAMTVVAPRRGEVSVTISLRGFTAAFNDLD
ncbi:invasion associated locus B family protein [Paralimibaculum aggregatum]|nr:invasion associated locus B family protein [Limibaculum sp. NKW23]